MTLYHQSAHRSHVEWQRLARRQARLIATASAHGNRPHPTNLDALLNTGKKRGGPHAGGDFDAEAWECEVLLMASDSVALSARLGGVSPQSYWLARWRELAQAASTGDPSAGALACSDNNIELAEGGSANAFFCAMLRLEQALVEPGIFRSTAVPHAMVEAIAVGSLTAMGGPMAWLSSFTESHSKREMATRLFECPPAPQSLGSYARSRLLKACGENRRFMTEAVLGACRPVHAPRKSSHHLSCNYFDRSGVHALIHISARGMAADPVSFSSIFKGAVRACKSLGRDPSEPSRGMVDRLIVEQTVFQSAERGLVSWQARGLGASMPAPLIHLGAVELASCLAQHNLLPNEWTGPHTARSADFYNIALSFWEKQVLGATSSGVPVSPLKAAPSQYKISTHFKEDAELNEQPLAPDTVDPQRRPRL